MIYKIKLPKNKTNLRVATSDLRIVETSPELKKFMYQNIEDLVIWLDKIGGSWEITGGYSW